MFEGEYDVVIQEPTGDGEWPTIVIFDYEIPEKT